MWRDLVNLPPDYDGWIGIVFAWIACVLGAAVVILWRRDPPQARLTHDDFYRSSCVSVIIMAWTISALQLSPWLVLFVLEKACGYFLGLLGVLMHFWFFAYQLAPTAGIYVLPFFWGGVLIWSVIRKISGMRWYVDLRTFLHFLIACAVMNSILMIRILLGEP